MKRITLNNHHNLQLVGHLFSVNSDKIVIMAHGFTSDKSSQGRFDLVAKALNDNGIDAFAFDFSGCGESDETLMTASKQVEDLKCVIDYIKAKGYDQIGLFGNSLGTLICLRCYEESIKTMVLMGALTHAMYYNWHEEFTKEQMTSLKEKWVITLTDSESRQRQLGQEMLNDFENIDQEKLLSAVQCPVFIIHGNHPADEEELKLLEHSKNGMTFLPKASKLHVIDGAKHGCSEYIDEVSKLTSDWFKGIFE